MSAPSPSTAAPRWPAAVGVVLCLAGLAVAAYLTYAHFNTQVVLACPDKGIINCAKVTTSTYSKFFGIPVALLGLSYFASMLPLQLPAAWRSTRPSIRIGRLASAVVGMVFVMWLLYAELVEIRNVCLYCTAVHALTFLLFVSTLVGTVATAAVPDDEREADDAITAGAPVRQQVG